MPRKMIIAIASLVIFLANICFAADPSHLVTSLPGQPKVNFAQYAGYVTVNEAAGSELFYQFFEANQPNHASLPLAIWFSGGPGCSSLGAGSLSELGPFRVNNAGTALVRNEFAWNEAANIIFVESPVGVGFSKTKVHSVHGDEETANDAMAFIVEWLKKFPEYSKNDLYLLGESYAGHYVPTLAAKLVQNKNINFKGFAVGNPLTEDRIPSVIEFAYTHNIISDETYAKSVECRKNGGNNCDAANSEVDQDLGKLDNYNIYAPACNKKPTSQTARKLMAAEPYDPCVDAVTEYLNNPAVKEALHADTSIKWAKCSDVNYRSEDMGASMVPLYQSLVKTGIKIMVYSGDADGVIPTAGTREWIKKLNLPIEIPWYPWSYSLQVGGYAQEYSGLRFATVRGAGHFVPFDKAGASLELFKSFLAGEKLPGF